HHVHGHDRLGARRDLGLHVGGIEVESAVHFREHRDRARIDDGGNAGDEGETRNNNLIPWTDAETGQGRQQGRGARVDRDGVADAAVIRDLLFHLIYFALEARIDLVAEGDPITKE